MQDLKHDTFKRSISINFPGSSGIPLWVIQSENGKPNKNRASYEFVKGYKFLGFAFFFLCQKVDDYNIHSRFQYTVVSLHYKGAQSSAHFGTIYPCECTKDHGGVSDQLWMEYFPKIAILQNYHTNYWRHLEILESSFGAFWIQSCGGHLIYIQDPQQNHTPELLD